jgi:hypothetical protein
MPTALRARPHDQFTLWIESEGEARLAEAFLDLPSFRSVNVAKTGIRRDIGDGYLEGIFRTFDCRERVAGEQILSGRQISGLVQWGIPDIIVSNGEEPLLSIELTSHKLTYNNLFQRLPKVYCAARCGVPSYLFQKRGVDDDAKYEPPLVEVMRRIERAVGTTCRAILYDDDEASEQEAVIARLIDSYCTRDEDWIRDFHALLDRRDAGRRQAFDLESFARMQRRTLAINENEAVYRIGVTRQCDKVEGILCGVNHCHNPADRRINLQAIRAGTHLVDRNNGRLVKCMWLSKGTGGLDPYPGVLLANKILFCTDEDGRSVRRLVAEFAKIPRSFWWWDATATRLNNRLIEEIADEVRYTAEAAGEPNRN